MLNSTSERLKRNSRKIMNLWEERTIKEISAAHKQGAPALRDSLPDYIEHLSEALSTTVDRTEARLHADKVESTRVGKKHGKERASFTDYTLDQLIFEYHILRQVICDVMEEEALLTPVERELIVCSIEQAVNDAATQFSETLSEIQRRLTQTLAHDLRNPIAAAKVSAQIILKRPDDVQNCINKASRICTNMDRLDNMIRDLLDASRLRAGQTLQLEFKDCDLDWIIQEVASEENFTQGNRIVVKSDGPCFGYWNESGLRRMTENLVSNAIKYGQEGTPITISLVHDKKTATLKIHNEGREIPAEEKSILFQQYRRSKSTDKKVGWGLGLTLVQGMVEVHNGNIDIESSDDTGTTFIIKLPKDPSGGTPNHTKF